MASCYVFRFNSHHFLKGWIRKRFFICLAVVVSAVAGGNAFGADETLDFGFIKDPPGKLVLMGPYRLHVNCVGKGDVTVLFEAGLGGSSLEWSVIQNALAGRVVACSYDRAGYAWSDPSPYARTASQLGREAASMLAKLGINGPLILVGHSFGGFVIRELALIKDVNVVGMVLVDASHENQLIELEGEGKTRVMPSTGSFVLKSVSVSENFPRDIRRKIEALGRMRKTYAAIHGEMGQFRASTDQVREHRQQVEFPVVVLTRGIDPYPDTDQGREKNSIWNELQDDLTMISSNGKRVIAEKSGHHIHADEPELIVESIEALLNDFEKAK